MADNIEELSSSELGTKEFWDKSYNLEIKNYKDHGELLLHLPASLLTLKT